MDNLKTSFGKRKLSVALKTSLVQKVFTDVAKKYDVMNDLMSLGAHRLWKNELIDLMNIQLTDTIIDVGSGTGDLIDLILNKRIVNSIYSIDLNNEMLKYGKKRFKNKNVYFVKSNAEKLPFKNDFFDKYTISFCLRNITDIKKALYEAIRVLKPGGTFEIITYMMWEDAKEARKFLVSQPIKNLYIRPRDKDWREQEEDSNTPTWIIKFTKV